MKRVWLIVFSVVVLGIAVFSWWQQHQLQNRYDPWILQASRRYDVDPALVKALIWKESRFRADARGRAGELGLMQVREYAAMEWADAEKRPDLRFEQLLNPRLNILAGTWYLSKLLKRYRNTDNPIPYALADYNAGRSNVLRWKTGPAATNSAAFLQQMTFPGTRRYILAILHRYRSYRSAGTF